MTSVLDLPRLTAYGHELDMRPASFGELRPSIGLIDDAEALRERMREDGYLYLPGYLDRQEVLQARGDVMAVLAKEGLLDPDCPPLEGVRRREGRTGKGGVRADVARNVPTLQGLLYGGRMLAFYRRFLGGDVLHFSYTWLRAILPGRAAAPHYDIVFMGRGTPNLYTAWTPLGDITYEMGGLMILEQSHRLEHIKNTYGQRDVDTYCANHANNAPWASNQKRWSGHLSKNAVRLRDTLGGHWLTAEFRMGDLLTFGMFTLHASIDNQTDRVRLSSDSRYQLASEPADERWIGEQPIAHGVAGRRGRIC
jgi:hypothetical protein